MLTAGCCGQEATQTGSVLNVCIGQVSWLAGQHRLPVFPKCCHFSDCSDQNSLNTCLVNEIHRTIGRKLTAYSCGGSCGLNYYLKLVRQNNRTAFPLSFFATLQRVGLRWAIAEKNHDDWNLHYESIFVNIDIKICLYGYIGIDLC